MDLKSSNPVFGRSNWTVTAEHAGYGPTMTIAGTVNKAGILLICVALTAGSCSNRGGSFGAGFESSAAAGRTAVPSDAPDSPNSANPNRLKTTNCRPRPIERPRKPMPVTISLYSLWGKIREAKRAAGDAPSGPFLTNFAVILL